MGGTGASFCCRPFECRRAQAQRRQKTAQNCSRLIVSETVELKIGHPRVHGHLSNCVEAVHVALLQDSQKPLGHHVGRLLNMWKRNRPSSLTSFSDLHVFTM